MNKLGIVAGISPTATTSGGKFDKKIIRCKSPTIYRKISEVAFGRRRNTNRITEEGTKLNNIEEHPLNINGKFSEEINIKLTVLTDKGCVCLLYENLREVSERFKTSGVSMSF